MKFEKVHTIGELYDGIRTGTADLNGSPHYFSCVFDKAELEYAPYFQLYPITTLFMERELRVWNIYRAWEARHHRGLEPVATHPGHGGLVPEYDDLTKWLTKEVKLLKPASSVYTPTFRVIPGQDELPAGILRELEVSWQETTV